MRAPWIHSVLAASFAIACEPVDELGCEGDGDCPDGLFCAAGGVCRAPDPCAEITCDEGTECEDGACVPGGPCGGEQRIFPPAVLFVVDRSCSMANGYGTAGVTKWEAAAAALSATAFALDDELLFGLALFPDTSGDRCTQTDVTVPINDHTASAIDSILTDALDPMAALFPDGPCVTNIDTAMEQAASLLGVGDLDAQVVLVTDGRQAGCNVENGEAEATLTISTLYDFGVETVVVGFDRNADAEVLDQFARAGGRPNTDPDVDFYPATEPAALEATLTDLANDALDCAFRLREEPPDTDALYVFVDGVRTSEVDYDVATRTITLSGDACAALSAGGDVAVDVVFGGCPAED